MTTPSTPARRVRSLKVRRRPWTVKRSTIFDLHANPPSLPEPSWSPETAGLGREHPTGVDAGSLLLEESAPVVAEDVREARVERILARRPLLSRDGTHATANVLADNAKHAAVRIHVLPPQR